MIVDELKDSILESAIRGTLVYNSKDNASELLQKMIEKKEKMYEEQGCEHPSQTYSTQNATETDIG